MDPKRPQIFEAVTGGNALCPAGLGFVVSGLGFVVLGLGFALWVLGSERGRRITRPLSPRALGKFNVGPKQAKFIPKWPWPWGGPKMVQNGPKMEPNVPKMIQNGPG